MATAPKKNAAAQAVSAAAPMRPLARRGPKRRQVRRTLA